MVFEYGFEISTPTRSNFYQIVYMFLVAFLRDLVLACLLVVGLYVYAVVVLDDFAGFRCCYCGFGLMFVF